MLFIVYRFVLGHYSFLPFIFRNTIVRKYSYGKARRKQFLNCKKKFKPESLIWNPDGSNSKDSSKEEQK